MSLTIQVRTHDNLLELLARGESATWVVARDKERSIERVQVVNFVGTQMIEGLYNRDPDLQHNGGRLVIKFHDARITNCHVVFDSQNPVRYIETE